MQTRQRNYKQKFIFIVMLVLVCVIMTANVALYITAKNIIEEQIGMTAQDLATTTALLITDTIDEYKVLLETMDEHSDYYKKTQGYFDKIRAESNLKFIYTDMWYDSETIKFVLDCEHIGSPDHIPIGTLQLADPLRRQAYELRRPVRGRLTHPILGELISAYAPLYDRDYHFLGMLGVGFEGSMLYERLNSLFITIIATSAIIILVVLVLLIRFSDILLVPITMDGLTGIYNKKFLEMFLQSEIRASEKSGASLSVLMLDLDHFKRINDTYGHTFGDKVLKAMAKLMKSLLRKGDCIARYGGEEFIIVLTETEIVTALEIAERIRKTVEDFSIFNEDADSFVKLTISIGAAQMSKDTHYIDDLIKNADKALYLSKTHRNMVSGFTK